MNAKIRIQTDEEAGTAALAGELAARILPTDVVLLSGPIGAGKSVFARALIQSLQRKTGLAEDVPSPTFTLVQRYEAGDFKIVHADLYRLRNSLELEEIGLLDDIGASLCLIEWPELLPDWAKTDALEIAMSVEPAGRLIEISAPSGWNNRLKDFPHGE